MAVVQVPFLVAVLLLVSPGLHCSSPPAACPESCTCQRASLLNCSSSGLSSVPEHIQDSFTGLDLSQNRLDTVSLHRPYRNLRNVWLENNTITRLSLCMDTNLGTQSVRGRHSGRLGLSSRRRCVSWAPALQLLSVERNQLMQLPEGLEHSASLWVLQLSFNRISTLRPGELRHLRQLKELHLKHNLITNLHPQMFQDLAQLKVLDLSFNMLTNLHPSMYLSLRNIGSDVKLDGNRWQCDCSMRSLRRRMVYDSNRGLQTWGVVCAFPSVHSGKDLLLLEEDDLNCYGTENSPELHRDVTVYSGSEILLSCSKQDSLWLTPSGQESGSGPQASLLISDVTDKDTGLYVCMTEDHEVVSVFNLQISRVEHARRKTRSLPRNSRQVIPQITTNRIGQERNTRATQSDLALAVCLSVFITFLIAFILGVIARPFIEVLCTKITNKRNPPATNSVSSAQQRQYENEAYSEGEEPEEIVTHRERRVTFRTVNIGEDINVEYYDTVAGDNQQSVEAAKTEEDEHTAGYSGSENGSRQINPVNNQRDARDISGTTNTRRKHKVQFDNIPDSEKLEERSLSSCSDSSLSDRELKNDRINKRIHTSPESQQRTKDFVQQGADSSTSEIVEMEELSIERTREMSEFSSEPFADWSPHADDTKPTDSGLWQENEEQFEFSDSVGSDSARSSSLFGSFNDSKRKVLPTSDIQSRDDVSSCSSSLSADEPTQYTVNPDQEEEDTEINHNKSDFTNTKQDASFQQQISGVDTSRPPVGFNQGNYPHDTLRPAERPEQTSSSQSSDSEQMQNTVNEKVEKEEVREYYKPSSMIVAGERDTREKIKPTPQSRWRGVSLGVKEMLMTSVQIKESQTASHDSDAHWPALDFENTIRIKRRLDIKAPSPSPDSSSSSDSEDETTGHPEKKRPQKVDHSGFLLKKSQTANLDPDRGWPALDLEHIPTIKRRLDVKVPSPSPDSSSSSDIEDGTTHLTKRPGKVEISQIKKQDSGSSSSSESDDETTGQTEKKRPLKVHHSGLLLKESQKTNHGQDARWPAVDLENIPTIKRRLDIKAPSPPPDSSSSSDSDDETTHVTERPGKVGNAALPLQKIPAAAHYPNARWPALDLEHIPTIKRRLDVKVPSPSPDSSSSSDIEDGTTHLTKRPGKVEISQIKKQDSGSSSSSESDDETTGHTEKKRPLKVHHSGLLLKESQKTNHGQDARWPAVDLENIPTIKRHLDIKVPSPPPDSFSSSDSDDETTHVTERPGKVGNAALSLQKIPAAAHYPNARWPALDLEHIPTIKRRLDVKAPSPSPDSSSSSDSEDETTGHTEKTIPQKVHHSGLLLKESQTSNHGQDARWPAVDLENIPTIKRRLDVKAPSPPPDSSSSSDSDDETTHVAEGPGKVGNAALPLQKIPAAAHDPAARWPVLDLEHIPTIKRRLDVKAPSPPPNSSSSSDSEDGTTHLTKRPWKVDISQIRIQDSGSSSSSESDNETTGHTEKKRSVKFHHSGLLLKESQKANHGQDARWPAVDLENIPTIKRRLDIKAPSPPPDSSSSSDSEDETAHAAERPGKVGNAALPLQKYPTAIHDPAARWPALDLEHIPTIKRRLDVKAPSHPPDSSSSSDSEDETTGHTEKTIPQKVHHSGLLLKEYPTATHDPDARWPALDLENIPTIKRRLDVKAPSHPPDSSSSSDSKDKTTHLTKRPGKVDISQIKKQDSGSSSSSGSDDETTGHTEKKRSLKVHHSGLLLKESQKANHGQDARWPAVDLENIPTIKRRLDIKAPSPRPDSSSSSDSDDETTHATERPGKVGNAALPLQKIPTATHDPDARWPALDLEHIPTIKRRLDIKAPSPSPDSSSSSDSEDGTTHLTKRPWKVDISQIKKQDSGSSSSSGSDDETAGHTEKKRSLKVHHSGVLLKESQKANRDLDARWPALNLENIPTIKRHLDIKAPSPDSNSSSSSDNEEDVTHHKARPAKVDIVPIKKHEQGNLSTFPLHEFKTESYDPLGSAVNLNHITRIKRRLDIKAPSSTPQSLSDESKVEGKIKKANKISPHYSSSSSVEQDEYTEDISNPSMTIKPHPDPRWPELGPISAPHIKRHLDIKTHSPSTESSSSSDKSDSESTNLPVKVERDRTVVGITNYQPGTQFPDMKKSFSPINRRLNIRGPPQPADSSFSSSANGTLSSHTEKHEMDKDGVRITTQEQQKVTHNINLGIPKMRRRLDIKAPSPQPDLVLDSTSADVGQSESNSSTSESEDENGGNKVKWSPKTPLINISPKPKTDHTIKLEKYTVITDDLRDQPTYDNISPTPEINPELQSRWNNMNLGVSRFRKRLDITSRTNVAPNLPTTPLPDSPSSYTGESGTGNKTSSIRLQKNLVKVTEEKSNPDTALTGLGTPHVRRYLDTKVREKAPGTSPLHQRSDFGSSSESEGISTEYADYTWRGTSQLSVVPDVAAPQNRTSLLVTHVADESRSGTQVERKVGVELKSQASEEGDGSASMWPHLSLTNIPKVKKALDIRAPLQRESFSSSNSEDETDHTVPELKPGVPHINRRLNIKAPSPEPNTSSSSSSESDNEVTGYSAKQSIRSSNKSAMTDIDYSQIAYKRTIIKSPRQRDSFSSSGRSQTSDHPDAQAGLSHTVRDGSASLSQWGVSRIEQQSTLDVSPEIRWTGIRRNLPDLSSAGIRLDLGILPPQRAPPAEPELTPPDSSTSSDKIKQDRVKAHESLMQRFSHPTASRGSVASSSSLDKFDNTSRSKSEIFRALSEDRKEKKGLGALKAISSNRLQWDTEDKDKDAV